MCVVLLLLFSLAVLETSCFTTVFAGFRGSLLFSLFSVSNSYEMCRCYFRF